jgi:micrococcal nuclease
VNKAMIQEGYAFFYPHSRTLDEFERSLLDAQQEAMSSYRGFWAGILRMPEAGQGFVGSRKSRRFHTGECPFGRRIHWRNKVNFVTLREAFAQGFAPCRECTVWPEE